jgi:PTH1 family peptidyl-tRNA hydrolase
MTSLTACRIEAEMKLVVGLGNPGRQYARTRHNAGWRVAAELAGRLGAADEQVRFSGWFVKVGAVGLLRPTTFMNESGRSVLAAMQFYKLDAQDVLIVSDDLNLALGQLRLRPGGSDGGHNGLADIIGRLGHDRVPRLRVGIGPVQGPWQRFVLSPFADDELPVIGAAIEQAADCVQMWLTEGIAAAMNEYNRRPEQ